MDTSTPCKSSSKSTLSFFSSHDSSGLAEISPIKKVGNTSLNRPNVPTDSFEDDESDDSLLLQLRKDEMKQFNADVSMKSARTDSSSFMIPPDSPIIAVQNASKVEDNDDSSVENDPFEDESDDSLLLQHRKNEMKQSHADVSMKSARTDSSSFMNPPDSPMIAVQTASKVEDNDDSFVEYDPFEGNENDDSSVLQLRKDEMKQSHADVSMKSARTDSSSFMNPPDSPIVVQTASKVEDNDDSSVEYTSNIAVKIDESNGSTASKVDDNDDSSVEYLSNIAVKIDESNGSTASKVDENDDSSVEYPSKNAVLRGSSSNPITLSESDSNDDRHEPVFIKAVPVPDDIRNKSRQELEEELNRLIGFDLPRLPDRGLKIIQRMKIIKNRLNSMKEVEIMEVRKPLPSLSAANLDEGRRLFGGTVNVERHERVRSVTDEALARIHSAITDAPENSITETPQGMTVDLMHHQKCGLTWMLYRESGVPRGGILADDMGLGKTISLISLILAQKNARQSSEEAKKERKEAMLKTFKNDDDLIPAFSTLVVAPASVIFQWEKEIKDRVQPGKLKTYVFHGPKRESDPRVLARYDIVITTYAIISSELGEKTINDEAESSEEEDEFGRRKPHAKSKRQISKKNKSVLTKIGWERVILDEAHNIRNRLSLTSKGCCRLPAHARWALTGTPINNSLWDLFTLVKFLRVSPFGEEKMWKEFIMSNDKSSSERIDALTKSLLLRRTKQQTCPVTQKPLVGLKPKTFEIVQVHLQGLEEKCYQQMFEVSKQKAKQLIEIHGDIPIRRKKIKNVVKNPFRAGHREIDLNDKFQGMSAILMLLLRLRQACVHMSLTRDAVDLDAFKDDGGDDIALDELEQALGNISINDGAFFMDENGKKVTVDGIFLPTFMSSKIKVLCEKLDHVLELGDKCVIVSQWTSVLDIVEMHLKQRKVVYTSITGKILTKDRQERVDSFNQKKGGAQVMLLSLTAGGVGLNLIGGNHLFLVDLHWNPALEQQACDRIYRVGQQKDVFIHKLVAKDTIEQRVLDLQEQKTLLAKGVLEGAAKITNKLSINDLKHLFNLNRPTAPKKLPEIN